MSGRTTYTELANQMQARPGEWVTVGTYNSANSADNIARTIRTAYRRPKSDRPSPWAPALSFQARTQPNDDGTSRVEARWVGDKSRGGYE